MIFSNIENITSENINFIEKEKQFLLSNIEICKKKKETILNYMQNFANSLSIIDTNSVNNVLESLEKLKQTLELCNDNLSSFDTCINSLDTIIFSIKNNSQDLNNILTSFNSDYAELNSSIIENTLKIENALCDISKISELQFTTNTASTTEVQSLASESLETKLETESSQVTVSDTYVEEVKEYKENTLIVSETSGEVTLPYDISTIKELFEKHPEKYSSIDGVIKKNYTLPISMFKNPFVSRFREAFKLIREREHGSVAYGFELGLELMFNYNLHPAVISACKTLDELDIYLDYLESGQTSKFNCFKIIFELPPVVVKKKKNSF